jgi:NAD(P)-dependent dehydrogenase (short-subunit alcohol dehydrogenase family)
MGKLQNILSIAVILLAVFIAAPRFSSNVPIAPLASTSLEGQTVVITGATSGVGREAAITLAGRGATLIITGRSQSRASKTVLSLPIFSAATPHAGLQLDLTDPESIETFTSTIKKLPRIDAIVLNAGMMYGPDYTGPFQTSKFPGGPVDTMIASNHLGSFKILHDMMSTFESQGTRIVFVSSISHHLGTPDLLSNTANPTGGSEGSSLSVSQSLSAFALYGQTKLFNVLSANKLSKLLPNCPVTVVTPGFCATTIGNMDRTPGIFNPLEYVPFTFTAEQGGDLLVAALQIEPIAGKMLQPYWIWESVPLLKGRVKGAFFNIIQEMFFQKLVPSGMYLHTQSEAALDEELQERAWEWSKGMIGA